MGNFTTRWFYDFVREIATVDVGARCLGVTLANTRYEVFYSLEDGSVRRISNLDGVPMPCVYKRQMYRAFDDLAREEFE